MNNTKSDIRLPLEKYKNDFIFTEDKLNRLIAFKTKKESSRKILLTGGIHGDEIAGVKGIIYHLDKILTISQANDIQFYIIPCLNPSGYELNQRNNIDNFDINREFSKDSKLKEVKFLIDFIKEAQFELALDFHETAQSDTSDVAQNQKISTEFYLYEVCIKEEKKIGRKLLKLLKSNNVKISNDEKIFGDINQAGLISYPKEENQTFIEGRTLDLFLFNEKYTELALTIETIAELELKERIRQIGLILDYLYEI